MTDKRVEAAARAICRCQIVDLNEGQNIDTNHHVDQLWSNWIPEARAALAAADKVKEERQ